MCMNILTKCLERKSEVSINFPLFPKFMASHHAQFNRSVLYSECEKENENPSHAFLSFTVSLFIFTLSRSLSSYCYLSLPSYFLSLLHSIFRLSAFLSFFTYFLTFIYTFFLSWGQLTVQCKFISMLLQD